MNDLELVADYFHVARPHVILDFRAKKDWFCAEGMDVIKRHSGILCPKYGGFLVSRHEVVEDVAGELKDTGWRQGAEEPGGASSETGGIRPGYNGLLQGSASGG